MEILQNGYHLLNGRFLSFLKPWLYGMGKLLFVFGFIDKQVRNAFYSFLINVIKNPLRIFKKVSTQSLLILQPQDILPTGKQDLCDGCPNKTYYNGNLVSMCRKEEYLSFGDMITLKQKDDRDKVTREHFKEADLNIGSGMALM